MNNKLSYLFSMVVFLTSLAYFLSIFLLYVQTDLQTHALTIQNISDGKILAPANFLFYVTVYITALCYTETVPLFLATSFVLALAVTTKFVMTRRLVEQHLKNCFSDGQTPGTIFLWLSVSMLLVFSLPTPSALLDERYYLGSIPPNVWHNSTTIFLMPFALLLFFKSYQQLERPTFSGIFVLSLLCLLNIVAKPSFFFVFALAYPLMLLQVHGLRQSYWLNIVPVLIGLLLVGVEYYLIYKLSFGNLHGTTSGVSIDLFHVWAIYSKNIAFSLLASLLFPTVYLALYWRDLYDSRLVQYSVLSYLIGLVIFCLFAETGQRLRDGNFFWQTVVCSYILFLVLLIQFVKKIGKFGLYQWKNRVIIAAFSLHAISGVFYLGRMLVLRSFV